jgi:hypothetical protein
MYDAEYDEWMQMEEDRKSGESLRNGEAFCNLPEHEYDSSLGLRGDPIKEENRKKFETKDSGKRFQSPDGMVRDTSEGKPQFTLLFPKGVPFEDQLMTRVADLYHRGGVKYGARNWEKSSTEEALAKHEDCLMRHVIKFLLGVEDGEDHAAAVVWNVNAVDLTRRKIREAQVDTALDKLTPQATAEPRPLNHDPLDFTAGSYSGPAEDFISKTNQAVEFSNGDTLLDKDVRRWMFGDGRWHCKELYLSCDWTNLVKGYGPLYIQNGAYAGLTILKDGGIRHDGDE